MLPPEFGAASAALEALNGGGALRHFPPEGSEATAARSKVGLSPYVPSLSSPRTILPLHSLCDLKPEQLYANISVLSTFCVRLPPAG